MRFMTRDFVRAAAFFFIVPFLAALSSAFWSVGSIATAPFESFASMSFEISFTAVFIVFARRTLKTLRLSEDRYAFFAELVCAIGPHNTENPFNCKNMLPLRGAIRSTLYALYLSS